MSLRKSLPPDPFEAATGFGKFIGLSAVTAEERIKEVGSFSKHDCYDALDRHRAEPYLQRSVVDALKNRLRWLERMEETR